MYGKQKQFIVVTLIGLSGILGSLLAYTAKSRQSFPQILGINTAAVSGISCQSMVYSPQKTAYLPGESITLSVTGSANATNIAVHYASSTEDLTTWPGSWKTVNGSYNSSTHIWTGIWQTPLKNGEYIIVPTIFNSAGQVCSGNPGYTCSGCEQGVEGGTGIAPGVSSCQGCSVKIAVNSAASAPQTSYDLKKYWNMSPGNYWLYSGNTYDGTGSVQNSYTSRLSNDEKVTMCNHTVLPWRFTKDNQDGYWEPGSPNTIRLLLSYFQSGENWPSTSVGAIFNRMYNRVPQLNKGISDLGTYCPTCAVKARFIDNRSHFYYYYPPYLYVPPATNGSNIQGNWNLSRIDRMYTDSDGIANNQCMTAYNPNSAADDMHYYHYWNVAYIPVDNFSIHNESFSYSGPALRFKQIEGWYPLNTDHFLFREDWYFVKDIGIVQIEQKDLRSKCPILDSDNQPVNDARNDPDCYSMEAITKPRIRQTLSSYYVGGALSVSVSPSTVSPTGNYVLTVRNPNGTPYTGYLQAKSCVQNSACNPTEPGAPGESGTHKWGAGTGIWVNNGVALETLASYASLPTGLYHSYFRPWVDTTPADTPGETRSTTTVLPWSNEVRINVGEGTCPNGICESVSGDTNSDGAVNGTDLATLVSNYYKILQGASNVGDFNTDTTINVLDFDILKKHWTQGN